MAENMGDMIFSLKTDSKRFDSGIDKAGKKTKELEKGFKRTGAAASALKRKIIGVGAAIATAFVAKTVISGIVKTSASFEQMRLQLDVLTKGKGVETLEKINKWALEMPVNTQKAVKAFVTMQAFGLNPTIKKLETLTNVAVIFGEEALGRVSRALGQMAALGKLSAEELNQLSEVGINARKILKDAFGQTVEEIQKSGIAIEKVIDAIWQGMDVQFAGAARKGMTAWQGLTSVFQSYVLELQKQIGDAGVFALIKDHLGEINKTLGEWIKNNKELIKQRTETAIIAIEVSLKGLKLTLDVVIGPVNQLYKGLKKIAGLKEELKSLAKTLFRLMPLGTLLTDKEQPLISGARAKVKRRLTGRIDKDEPVGTVQGEKVQAVQKALNEEIEATNDLFTEMRLEAATSFSDIATNNESMSQRIQDATMGWASDFSSQLWDIFTGAEFSFKGILKSFVDMIGKMFVQLAIIEPLMKRVFGAFSKGGGGGGSPVPFSLTAPGLGGGGGGGGGLGGIFNSAKKILGFAQGGIVPGPVGAPVPAIVHGGEEYTPPGQSKSGGEVVQNINISPGLPETVRAEILRLLPTIERSTVSAVLAARGRGGTVAAAIG